MSIARWRPSDPGGFALRLALRTAIMLPATFALGIATGNEETALFCAFGAIALLLFVDFGGPTGVRIGAYLSLLVAGAGLISLGTLCSQDTVAATVGMVVIGFAILFAGVLNGYIAAGSSAALLAFILPAMVSGSAADIPPRLLGWAIAGATCVPASFLLFAARPRDRLRSAIAEALRAIARLLSAPQPTPQDEREVSAHVDAMHERFAATPFRPTGPAGATGALAQLIGEVTWLHALLLRIPRPPVPLEPTAAERDLRARSAAALTDSAALVEGQPRDLPDVAGLERVRAQVVDELVDRLDDPALRADPPRMWAAVLRAWEARVVSYATLDVADRAMVAGGATGREMSAAGFIRRQSVALAASGRMAAAHAGVRSVWFRNSVRGAIGLAAAVLVGHVLEVQHAFWVVLGALSVLRSSALSTGASIVQALLGTAAGLVIGAPILILLGDNDVALWCVLPFAAMLSAYAPRAISFAAGQTGFTVAIFIIFDLIERTGWEVGVVRIEDVSIGFAISLLVGVLFWPRGAGALLRGALAEAIAASARHLDAGFRRFALGEPADRQAAMRDEAAAASARLDAAFRQRLAERSGQHQRLVPHTRLLAAASRLDTTAVGLAVLSELIDGRPRPAGATRLLEDAGPVCAWYERAAQAVGESRPAPEPTARDAEAHAVFVDALRDAAATGDRDATFAAMLFAWTGLHLDQMRMMEDDVAEAARAIARPGPKRETPG
ncbi:MAG TPA: FUSC family protein [Capillimicrobium sp.]|nr:FUSC family protein [Capillimicrobium sp.]